MLSLSVSLFSVFFCLSSFLSFSVSLSLFLSLSLFNFYCLSFSFILSLSWSSFTFSSFQRTPSHYVNDSRLSRNHWPAKIANSLNYRIACSNQSVSTFDLRLLLFFSNLDAKALMKLFCCDFEIWKMAKYWSLIKKNWMHSVGSNIDRRLLLKLDEQLCNLLAAKFCSKWGICTATPTHSKSHALFIERND